MLRSSLRPLLLAPSLALLLAALAAPASAQQSTQPAAQAGQNQAPPKLERIEPGSDVPATNIPPRTRTTITEKRENGQVTEVDVNAMGSHYTMKPNNPPGNAVPGSATGNSIRAPQWKIGEFDLSGKRKAPAESSTPTAAEAPPPPRDSVAPEKK